jgi:2-dehydropantoate 2-reductase
MNPKKILIIGAGAIGSFYGALLAKAGARVSVVCRSDYTIVKEQGIQIDSLNLGQWTFRPEHVLAHSKDYPDTADTVILCTKVIPSIDRIALLRPAVSPQTRIVFIQNGVGIESELTDAFPNHDVISGLAFICCNRTAPGQIKHLAYGKLTLGSLNYARFGDSNTKELCQLINQAGIEAITSSDIITSRWLKCLWNASFNPLSVLSGGLPTQTLLKHQEPLIRRIMNEVSQVASASGHPLPPDSIDMNITHTAQMPPYKTSMLLDFERHQPMEIDAIIGNTLQIAAKLNIDTPILQTLYALMKLKEIPCSVKQ